MIPPDTPLGFTKINPNASWANPEIAAHWGRVRVINSSKNPAGPVSWENLARPSIVGAKSGMASRNIMPP